jgi:hypothetical protein
MVAAVVVWWWWHPRESPTSGHDPAPNVQPASHRGVAVFAQRGITGRTIAGVVVDGDHRAVAGAKVHLSNRFTLAHVLPEATAISDASGAFAFLPQPAMAFALTAESPLRIGTQVWIDLRDPGSKSDHVTLVLHPCEATLHGTVRDAGGGVVPNARVGREVGAASTSVEADAQGNYELCLPIGAAVVSARADGYARSIDDLYAIGRIHHDFSLGPEATVVGHVVRSRDHAPVEGAVLELRDTTFRVEYASSGPDGRFNFSGIAPGRYFIVATADQLATARPVDVVAAVGAAKDETIELGTTYSVAGRVVEEATGTGVAGISVRARSSLDAERRVLDGVTQADGSFTIEHVLPGEYKAYVYWHDVHDPKPIEVTNHDVSG